MNKQDKVTAGDLDLIKNIKMNNYILIFFTN